MGRINKLWQWLVDDADDLAKDVETAGENADLLLEKGQNAIVKLLGRLLAIASSIWVGLGAIRPHLQKLPDQIHGTGIEKVHEVGRERVYRVRGRRETESPPDR